MIKNNHYSLDAIEIEIDDSRKIARNCFKMSICQCLVACLLCEIWKALSLKQSMASCFYYVCVCIRFISVLLFLNFKCSMWVCVSRWIKQWCRLFDCLTSIFVNSVHIAYTTQLIHIIYMYVYVLYCVCACRLLTIDHVELQLNSISTLLAISLIRGFILETFHAWKTILR